MLQFHPKKTKKIHNKSIPSPLRPKFRNKSANNMYFLSKGKTLSEKKVQFKNKILIMFGIIFLLIAAYSFIN